MCFAMSVRGERHPMNSYVASAVAYGNYSIQCPTFDLYAIFSFKTKSLKCCKLILVRCFTVIMGGVIKSVFRRDRRKRPKLTNRKIPYNYQLQIAKRTFKKYKDQFAMDPENLDRRDRYRREKRLYKKIIYKVKKNSHECRLNKIASLEQNDTKSFWKNVKKLLTPQKDGPYIISHPNWFRHFYGVLNARNSAAVNPQFLDYVTAALPTLEAHTELSAPLNSPITGEELRNVMKSVKSGKATYLDDISNDAIKLGLPILEEALLHVFNIVTSVQTFPGTWNVGLITPLHKKGDKLNADNYRGIIISSCVGKIYLKIMTSRIEKYMSTNDLWCINQCGFKKDHRTEDNLFVLNTIYESHVAREKEIFTLPLLTSQNFLILSTAICYITNHWNTVSPVLCIIS